jgi:predicted O-methyltransferase YrrM
MTIVETGTIRSTEPVYADDDGWSTVCFAEWVRDHAGVVVSIDLDVSAARKVLAEKDLLLSGTGVTTGSVQLLDGTSEHWLGELTRPDGEIHVAFLDSDNDPDLILREFEIVRKRMPAGAVLMVDDVDLRPGAEARKGLAIAPWLEQHGWEYTIAGRRGRGVSTGVLIARIP